MRYALVNGTKVEAFVKGKGLCVCCGTETLAKCGSKIIHHWAHSSIRHCDLWWENETEWHRNWKSFFPQSWQEVVHFDEVTGEKHIADVKTKSGLVIEFQNSPMSTVELNSRESFYKKMVWVINAKKFANNFFLRDKLPDPVSTLAKEVRFIKGNFPVFFRLSEGSPNDVMREIHSIQDIAEQINSNYKGHHLFDWVRPRTVWYESICEVFMDFGNEALLKLVRYDDRGLWSVQKILKKGFIKMILAGS